MQTSHIWMVALLLAAGGLVVQGMGDAEAASPWEDPLGLLGTFLVILPLTLALNVTMRRRRDASGASSPDSVESRAAQRARSQAYGDAVMLGALLFLTLAVVADTVAALTAMAFITLAVAAFWIRYRLALRALGG
ncbi:hypothetical protein [Ornithinimicrobium pekingense]|uniref:DUF2178 domain-containing protein n=1 Tax=Ornithinimicrobium pekingense TaxID=384677 RepID=A0ABQ2FEE1_9MICO|nr:hypothetical protein [Ornithinimicrobium pekingense]GGK77373.1 hypothetical protein GCM10011509_27430 [Ornithinimicrobium pekingense]